MINLYEAQTDHLDVAAPLLWRGFTAVQRCRPCVLSTLTRFLQVCPGLPYATWCRAGGTEQHSTWLTNLDGQ
jgi:hypothetical protein